MVIPILLLLPYSFSHMAIQLLTIIDTLEIHHIFRNETEDVYAYLLYYESFGSIFAQFLIILRACM